MPGGEAAAASDAAASAASAASAAASDAAANAATAAAAAGTSIIRHMCHKTTVLIPNSTTHLHGLVELVRRGQDVHAGTWNPEGRHMVGHPSEVAAEAVAAALSSDRPGRPGVAPGGGVSLGQEGGQQ